MTDDSPSWATKDALPVRSRWRGLVMLALLVTVLTGTAKGVPAPSLIVFIIVDGLSEPQFVRDLKDLPPGGFRRLAEEGSWFQDCHFEYASTYTAPGHATLMTGVYPNRHGIVGNEWYDRSTGSTAYSARSTQDAAPDRPRQISTVTSPQRLLADTFGDLLVSASEGASRVFSISVKDRSAVMTAGHHGKAFYWDYEMRRFVSSAYYYDAYPEWWHAYYRETRVPPLEEAYEDASLASFAREVLVHEALGSRGGETPDVLVLAFSTLDGVNHRNGAESAASRAQFAHLDGLVRSWLEFLGAQVGMDRTWVILSSDHGFTPLSDTCIQDGGSGGVIAGNEVRAMLSSDLRDALGRSDLVLDWSPPTVYLDYKKADESGISRGALETEVAKSLRSHPGIAEVFVVDQVLAKTDRNELEEKIFRSVHRDNSGDLFVVPEPCWFGAGTPDAIRASHGSPHAYDTHVPMVFFGAPFPSIRIDRRSRVVDLVPTALDLLRIPRAEGLEGDSLVGDLGIDPRGPTAGMSPEPMQAR